MDEENILIPETAPYHISREIYDQGYRTYQKMFVYPKNRIFQAIFLLLAIDFGYRGGKDPSNTMAFVLLMVCVAMIFIIWYNPRKMRRNVMDALREAEGDRFVFAMDSEKLMFSSAPSENTDDTEGQEYVPAAPSYIYLEKDVKAVEKADYFIICKGKKVFYLLPKYALYDNQADVVREALYVKLGRRFRCKV